MATALTIISFVIFAKKVALFADFRLPLLTSAVLNTLWFGIRTIRYARKWLSTKSIGMTKNNRILKISLAILLAAILGGGSVYLMLNLWARADLGEFTPDSATSTTMSVLKRRVLHYAKQKNKLPHSVDELPTLEGFYNTNTDYWGGKIIIQIDGTTVTLISYGKDQKPGGTGANLDLIASFEAKTTSGVWADENNDGYPSWKKQPVLRWNKADYR